MSDNDISNSERSSPPIKKVHRVCDKSIMVIDEGLVVKLGINNDNTWVEQILRADNEILLVIKKF